MYTDQTMALFGFSRESRRIDFIRRGRLHRGSGQCWEVWPYDGDDSFRLGSQFGIREHACVVVDGIAGVSAAAECWIAGNDMSDLARCADFWDKMDGSKPLEAQT